jgi:hypothetical protein
MMHSLFYGGLVLAGLFAFVPGRTMHNVFSADRSQGLVNPMSARLPPESPE